jgi:hypothetical protein
VHHPSLNSNFGNQSSTVEFENEVRQLRHGVTPQHPSLNSNLGVQSSTVTEGAGQSLKILYVAQFEW